MIAQVSGTVVGLGPTSAVVEIGGVGLSVQCSPNTTTGLRVGQDTQLSTALIVREDSLTLYGFAHADERDFFELLLTATGVGPKLAQAALAVLSPDELRTAIGSEDLVRLTKVPGIGRKGAQRIVIELKDKVNAVGLSTTAEPSRTEQSPWRQQVSQGLQGLGWPAKEAEAACEAVEFMAEDDPPATVPVLMRAALQSLAKKSPMTDFDPLDPQQDPDEESAESALRPATLQEFEGQERVSDQLGLMLEAARRRAAVPDHVLLSGPPGLGKTTLAMIIASEMSAPLRISSGPAIQHAGDLAAILSGLTEGEVFFLDEIHRMSRPAEEMLYLAMEDFRVDVVVGKGPGATAIPLEIPHFVLVGATTRAGLLPGPLRDRFGFTAQLDFYDTPALEHIVHRSAGLLGAQLEQDGAAEIARRSRGTPRIANRLLRRVRDFAQVRADGRVDAGVARAALELYEVDEIGLDRLDRAVLSAICRLFGGGPVGLSTLAISVGEERETVEEVAEPFLVREGFLMRTPRGRVATTAAWKHLGLTPPTRQRNDPDAPDLFG